MGNQIKQNAVSPGKVVADVLGVSAVVDGLASEFPDLSRSTVWRWAQPKSKGGTEGIIPATYHIPLLRLAKQMGCKLTPADLVLGRPQ